MVRIGGDIGGIELEPGDTITVNGNEWVYQSDGTLEGPALSTGELSSEVANFDTAPIRTPPTTESPKGLVTRDYASSDGPELIYSKSLDSVVSPGDTHYTFTNTADEILLMQSVPASVIGGLDKGNLYLAVQGQGSNDTSGESVNITLERKNWVETAAQETSITITNTSSETFMSPMVKLIPEDVSGSWTDNHYGWWRLMVGVTGGTGSLHRLTAVHIWRDAQW